MGRLCPPPNFRPGYWELKAGDSASTPAGSPLAARTQACSGPNELPARQAPNTRFGAHQASASANTARARSDPDSAASGSRGDDDERGRWCLSVHWHVSIALWTVHGRPRPLSGSRGRTVSSRLLAQGCVVNVCVVSSRSSRRARIPRTRLVVQIAALPPNPSWLSSPQSPRNPHARHLQLDNVR